MLETHPLFSWLKKYVLLQRVKIWVLVYFICLLQALTPSLPLHFYFNYNGHKCITESGQFILVCLAKPALITALSAMNNPYEDPMEKTLWELLDTKNTPGECTTTKERQVQSHSYLSCERCSRKLSFKRW